MPDGDFSLQATIEIDGSPLPAALEPQLETVIVDDHLHLPAMFVLMLRDQDRSVLTDANIRIGSRVKIAASALGDGRTSPLITGEVTSLEAEYDALGSRAIVRGYDPSHRFHRGVRTEIYVGVTDADAVKEVAARAGVDIGRIDDTPAVHQFLSQANVSDWTFLAARAQATGYSIGFDDGRLQFRRPTVVGGAPGEGDFESKDPLQLVMGQDLLEFRPRLTSSEQVANVEVRAWDQINQEAFVSKVDTYAHSADLDADPQSMAATFGSGQTVVAECTAGTQAAVDMVAKALADRVGSVFAEADGVVRGTPTLRAGTPFSVSVVGQQFIGRYEATTTRHVFDRDGYRTEFSVSGQQDRSLFGLVGSAGTSPLERARVEGVMVAVVTDIDDREESLGRVRVRFPTLTDASGYTSTWARVIQPGASRDAGQVFLPEVDDEVLVAFELGDLDRPYILGGLWSSKAPPPLGRDLVSNGRVRRQGIVSRKNHRLIFFDDDQDSGIAVMTGDDRLRISLRSTGSEIHVFADGKIVIEAKQDIQINGQQSISLEAQGQLTLSGKAGVKIESSGIVDVDGSLIQLN